MNQIDINFFKDNNLIEYSKLNNENKSLLPSFNAILSNDIKYIKEHYLKMPYIYKNTTLQTGLMLACYLGNYELCKCLINKEVGYVDLYDRSALFYAIHSINPNDDIIKLLLNYEYFEL